MIKRFYLPVALGIVLIFFVGIFVAKIFPDRTNRYQGEERSFGEYALHIAKIENFENPILHLFIFKISIQNIQNISDLQCLIYHQDGSDEILLKSYQASVLGRTFFGIPLVQANIGCQR